MEGPPPVPTAVVVARDEETRILLRGLLRLRHFRVIGEAEGSTHATELVRSHPPTVLVMEASLAEGSSAALIRETRLRDPRTRIVVVGSAGPGGPAPGSEPDFVLPRPFRIGQFEEAVALPPTPPARVPPTD